MTNKILRNAGEQTWQQALNTARDQLGIITDAHPLPKKPSKANLLERAAYGPPPPEADPAWLFGEHSYPECRRVLLTPELCEKLLDNLDNKRSNRRLNPRKIATYTRLVRQGRWYFTNLGVARDVEGGLQDGQKRCIASKLAGAPIDVLMCVGMPLRNFAHLDNGEPRTFAQVAYIDGIPNGRTVGSIARWVMQYQQWRELVHVRWHLLEITNEEFATVLQSSMRQDFIAAARLAMRFYGNLRMSVGAMGAAYCILREAGVPSGAIVDFMTRLTTNTAERDSPSNMVYRLVEKRLRGGDKIPPVNQLGMIIKAYNAEVTGSALDTARFPARTGELFPEPHPWRELVG